MLDEGMSPHTQIQASPYQPSSSRFCDSPLGSCLLISVSTSKCGSYHFLMERQEQTPVAPIQQEEKNPSAWWKSPNVYESTIKNRTLCEGTSRT